MPALRAFQRRWNLGSDDLVFPGVVEIVIRGIWFVVLLTIYLLKKTMVCDFAHKIRLFYIGTLCLLATQIILCVAMTWLSSRGTMVRRKPRKHVSTVLYLRLACFIPEVAWAIVGTIWMFEKGASCQQLVVRTGKSVVLVEWLLIACIVVSVILTFDPLGRRHMRKRSMKDYNEVWLRRCRLLCCCIWRDENRKGAFGEIADMLTKFFKYKDIVLSDVIAGLVLLHLQSVSALEEQSRKSSATQSQTGINVNNDVTGYYSSEDVGRAKEWMSLENADYYCRYAMGSYGRYNYAYCRSCDQRCGLCQKYKMPCKPSRYSPDQVVGDNSCQCHMAAVLQYTDIDPDDIIFANFSNEIYQTPYFVVLDELKKSVVVAIRGTKTFQDAVTDLSAFGEPFQATDVPPGNVHGGILKVARNIHQQLLEVDVLSRIPKGYDLILTGHSLGAGAAVLLGLLLKSRFPDLKCFAFSPPGGLLSISLHIYTQDFVCSVVLGNDVIPRLSLRSMENLKHRLLAVIKKSRLPKYKILASGMVAICCGWRDNIETEEKSINMKSSASTDCLFDMNEDDVQSSVRGHDKKDQVSVDISQAECVTFTSCHLNNDANPINVEHSVKILDSENVDSSTNIRRHREVTEPQIRPTTYQQFYQSHMKWKREREKLGSLVIDPMYLPGHILHLVEIPAASHLDQPRYHVRWAKPEDFSEIILSSDMLHHHHSFVMRLALQKVVAENRCHKRTHQASQVVSSLPNSSES